MKKYLKPIIATGLLTSLLIGGILLYIDATVQLPDKRIGTKHLKITIDDIELGNRTSSASFANKFKETKPPIDLACKDVSLVHSTNAKWYEKRAKSNEITGLESTQIISNKGLIGGACLTGKISNETEKEALKRLLTEITTKYDITNLPGGGQLMSIGEDLIYERDYRNVGVFFTTMRNEIISELDADRKSFEFQTASLHIDSENSYTISIIDKKILPQISPEERKKKLADLETAYDRLEKKFITHQLNNSWMMRSGLVMKIYMILGKITG